ncbi:MAG: hypothetical protein QW320_06610 [Ignisphaera sp.]|uniref:hypothetical protein n=1 Tax=Thermofilum sp. TaxID=1961369 RepID=UPI0031605159
MRRNIERKLRELVVKRDIVGFYERDGKVYVLVSKHSSVEKIKSFIEDVRFISVGRDIEIEGE